MRFVTVGATVRFVVAPLWNLWRRFWFDGVIVGLAVLSAVEVIFRLDEEPNDHLRGTTWLMAIAVAALLLPLLGRRRWPFGAAAAVFVVAIALSFWNGRLTTYAAGTFLAVICATFLFGMLWERERSPIGLGIAIGAAAVVVYNDPQQGIGDFGFIALTFTIAWLGGLALGSQLARAARALERAERLDRTREAESRAAVAEERARIARELHDIVGHSVSVMTVQASAVRRLLRDDQEREREALKTVEDTGREALAEMRRLVGVLRRPEEAPALVPQPILEYVGKLVEQTREAGLKTELKVEGEAATLPASIDLTAYRLVQEGLTNALKHARATHAEVLVRYADESVELIVRDDGMGGGNGDSGGHGLVGMRERVAVCGGELHVGPRPGGGYELRARLPAGAT
jgi:signal transduction histidine kinase